MKTRIQEFRKAAGYSSARAFAESNGYNAKTYTNWDREQSNPNLFKIVPGGFAIAA